MKTKQLCVNALLAAMCAVLGAVSVDLGNIKFTFESLPILLGALLFGPMDALAIGGIGTFIYQLLKYGLSVTTPLWMLPYMACGLLAGWYAKRRDFNLSGIQTTFIVFVSSILVLVLNTAVMYIDSKVYGYYSAAYIFGATTMRIVVCLVKAAAFSAVLPGLIAAVKKVLKK